MEKRIEELELQVKGLMETVTKLHSVWSLQHMGIPLPDQYLEGKGTNDDLSSSFPATLSILNQNKAALEQEGLAQEAIGSKTARKQNLVTKKSDVSSIEAYDYSPLRTDVTEIRLLALRASEDPSEPINCRLTAVNLDDQNFDSRWTSNQPVHQFATLSYTWGDPSNPGTIFVDGKSLNVTRSLYGALLHFRALNQIVPPEQDIRLEKEETYWWIDAVCINQKDVDEKSSQVPLMTALYRKSFITHVWLGDDGLDSQLAVELVRDLAWRPTTSEEWDSWVYKRRPGQTQRPGGPGMAPIKLLDDVSKATDDEKRRGCAALIALFRRPWFSRSWIRQEVALARDVRVHYGNETCDWEQLVSTAYLLSNLADEIHLESFHFEDIFNKNCTVSCFQTTISLDRLRQAQGAGSQGYIPFRALIFQCRDSGATDPRDKLFSMLPMANPDETAITADYRKNVREVYLEAVLSFSERSLDFLAACQNPDRKNGFPSWVPDFSEAWKHNPEIPDQDEFELDEVRAEGHGIREEQPQCTFDPNEMSLTVTCVLLDSIATIHQAELDSRDSNAAMRALTDRWWRFFHREMNRLICTEDLEWEYTSWITFHKPDEKEYWDDTMLDNGRKFQRFRDRLGKRYEPMSDFDIEQEPLFRKLTRRLLPESDLVTLKNEKDMGCFRRLALGRRAMISSKAIVGLGPAEARPGDMLCNFQGSWRTYVVREVEPSRWVVVGEFVLLVEGLKPEYLGLEAQEIKLI